MTEEAWAMFGKTIAAICATIGLIWVLILLVCIIGAFCCKPKNAKEMIK